MKTVSSVRRFSLPLPLAGEGRFDSLSRLRERAGERASGAGWDHNACAVHPLSLTLSPKEAVAKGQFHPLSSFPRKREARSVTSKRPSLDSRFRGNDDPFATVFKGERGKEKGFSLLEILVAFAIAAMALGLLYQIMGSNARQVGDLVDHERAMLLAESLLSVQATVPEAGLNETGQAAGYAWQIESHPYATPGQQTSLNPVPLHEVRVTVHWGEGAGRQFVLTSLRPQARPMPQWAMPS